MLGAIKVYVVMTAFTIYVLHNKKSQKRPFRGKISVKVASMTPNNMGFYIEIVECFRKNRIFLLNKVDLPTLPGPSQYIGTVHKL